jgi:RNase P/RNase MRP subunit p29
MTSRTVRRLTGGLLATAVAVSIASCSSDSDDDTDGGGTTSASGSSDDQGIPVWPDDVNLFDHSKKDVQQITNDRAEAMYGGDCDVLTDELTAALKRIAWAAGNEWRHDARYDQSDEWKDLKVTASKVDGPAPTDTACKYEVEHMSTEGLAGQVEKSSVNTLTIGALPKEKNAVPTDESLYNWDKEDGKVKASLDDLSYAPIGKAAASVAEDMVGKDGDYTAFTQGGWMMGEKKLGTGINISTDTSQLRMITTSETGKRSGVSESGWWLKVDGDRTIRNPENEQLDILDQTANRVYEGLLSPRQGAQTYIYKRDSLSRR